MPEVVVVLNERRKLEGLGEKGKRAWAKFLKLRDELDVGETLGFSYRLPRSRPHHGFFMCKLHELFDRQEHFADEDSLLQWLKVGAGYCELLPGPGGVLVAVPRSINWLECDEQTFIEVGRAIDDFMWTDYAQACLWPHLRAEQRHENVQGWHDKAEENRQMAIARRMAQRGE